MHPISNLRNSYQPTSENHSRKELATLICHPLAGGAYLSDIRDIAVYLQGLSLEGMPLSLKNLFTSTVFASSAAEAVAALQEGKEHVVLETEQNLLLTWEKKGNSYTLTVFCAPTKTNPPVTPGKGGIFSWIFAYKHARLDSQIFERLSEWNGSKNKVDPLAVSFKDLPVSFFSIEWLNAFEKGQNPLQLLAPLKRYMSPSPPLPPANDEKGWLSRFSTNPVGRNPAYWLYKQWMKRHLPLEDYRFFHFLHRLSLLEDVESDLQGEATSKLLRSLAKKGREEMKKRIPGCKEALLRKKTTPNEIAPRNKSFVSPSEGKERADLAHFDRSRLICRLPQDEKEKIKDLGDIPPILREENPRVALEDFEQIFENESGDLQKAAETFFKGNFQDDPKAFLERVLKLAEVGTGRLHHFWLNFLTSAFLFLNPKDHLECQKMAQEITKLTDKPKDSLCLPNGFFMYGKGGSISFNQESLWMDQHSRHYTPDCMIGVVPYITPECILAGALHTLSSGWEESPLRGLGDFFQEAFMTEELSKLMKQKSEATQNMPESERHKILSDALELRRKNSTLPWVTLLQDSLRRQFVEAFLEGAISILEKSQDDIFQPLLDLMLFSARLAVYQPKICLPDYEPLVRRLQRNTSSIRRDHILCIRTLLFWILAEKGDLERSGKYRPKDTDGWNPKSRGYDIRSWSFLDGERMRGWLQKIPAGELQEDDLLEATTFDWSSFANIVERLLEGKIDLSTWKILSPEKAVCSIILSSGWRKEVEIHQDGPSYCSIYWDKVKLYRDSTENLLNSHFRNLHHTAFKAFKKKLPLPMHDLLVGEESTEGGSKDLWLFQKSTGKRLGRINDAAFEMPDVVSGYWWDGEPIELTNDSTLRELPSLRWRQAKAEALQDHELIDQTGKVKKHVFHLPLFETDKVVSFAIDYENNCYRPKNLEEELCLLHLYLETENIEKVHELLKSLPLIPHLLSDMSMKLMKTILQIAAGQQTKSFVHLELSMRILENFHRWLGHPCFSSQYKEHLLMLTGQCLQTWQLYRNAHQNGQQNLLLSERERKSSAEWQFSLLEESSLTRFEGLFEGLFGWIFKKLFTNQNPPKIENVAWNKTVHDLRGFSDFTEVFTDKDNHIATNRNGNRWDSIHAFSREYLGRRYIFAERVHELSYYEEEFKDFVLTAPQNSEEVTKKRLSLGTKSYGYEEEKHYAAHLLDYALENSVLQKKTENFGEFLARLEQEKYTKNFIRRLGEQIYSLFSLILDLFRSWPIAVLPFMSSFRLPFTLSDRTHDQAKKIDERIVSLDKPDQRVCESKAQEKIRINILEKANQTNELREENLKARTAENVEWSHLEGLFIRNAMHRLQTINETLTQENCEEIDLLMHSYYLASPRTDYQYDPSQLTDATRVLLHFETVTGMTIRSDQIEKLQILLSLDPNTEQYRNLALQMRMAGGKTSVLASIALLLAAKPGRIAILIPLPAQFDSLAYDFSRWQKGRFQQEVIPIHLPASTLYEKQTLDWIKKQIKLAKTEGHALLIHPETLSHLQLLWRSCQDPELLKPALEIRQELLENGDAILDEIDKLLYPLKDTSLAIGAEKKLSRDYISSFRNLIELHKENPPVWQALITNKPQQINLEKYKKFQRVKIAQHLVDKTFSVPENLKESCKRYLVGEATQATDGSFLRWLDQNSQKDSINLHSHWLEDILRHTIFKEHGQHYGRSGKQPTVVAYDGIRNPSNRKFAQPGEEVSYYFLTALVAPYTENQLQEILKHNREISRYFPVRKPKIDEKIYRLFGATLKELEDVKIFEEAMQRINASPEARLELEEYFIRRHVVYYEHQITSTSQSFLSLFATHRGLSGTFPQFINDFDHEIEADKSADEGVQRAILSHHEPIVINDSPPDRFFTDLCQREGCLSGLIDMGARFKDLANEEVAKEVLKQLPYIQHVLFFGKISESDETADTPMLLRYDRKADIFHRHIVKSTKREALASWGVENLEELFVYFDERHCEAVDVEQLGKAKNVCTFNIHTTKRDFFQGIMRMRNYQGEKDPSTHQNALFVLDSSTNKALFGAAEHKTTPLDLIKKAKEIEAKEIAICSPRTYYHAIEAAFSAAIEEVLSQFVHSPKKLAELQSFFLYLVVDPSPSKQFGGVYVTKDSYLYFQDHIERRKQELQKIYPGKTLPKSLLQKLEKIDQNLTKALKEIKYLALKTSYKRTAFQVGQEQQQKQRQQQQQEQKNQRYSMPNRPKRGEIWEEKKNPKHCDLAAHYRSKNLFSSPFSSNYLVSESFDSRLLEGIQATENWLNTYTFTHALNHPSQKRAHFILLEKKEEKLIPTILSLYDYQAYVRNPETLPPESCVCTSQPFKNCSLTPCFAGDRWSSDLFTGQEERLKKLWIQLAFINANPFYIVTNYQDLGEPLNEKHLLFLRERIKYWRHFEDYDPGYDNWKEKSHVEALLFDFEEILNKHS
jgi:hypothetical protein